MLSYAEKRKGGTCGFHAHLHTERRVPPGFRQGNGRGASKSDGGKGNVPSRQEWRSWISSLQALADLLAETGLDEKILAGFEGQLPLSGKRADVVLASRRCLLVLELKQWRSAEPADGERPDLVRTWTGETDGMCCILLSRQRRMCGSWRNGTGKSGCWSWR